MADHFCKYMVACKLPEAPALDFLGIISAFRNVEIMEEIPELEDELETELPGWYARKHELIRDGVVPRSGLLEYMEDTGLVGISELDNYGYHQSEGILFFGSDQLDPSPLADILAEVMEENGCEEIIDFEVAYSCDKPLPGRFGGATHVVGPGMVKSITTRQMGETLREEMAQELAVNREQGPRA